MKKTQIWCSVFISKHLGLTELSDHSLKILIVPLFSGM